MDKVIESVADAIKIINNREYWSTFWEDKQNDRYAFNFPFGIWFRGQSNKPDWTLKPRIFHTPHADETLPEYDENSMFYHFQLTKPEYHNDYKTIFDWLCLMQHFKLPTRLLDWTESILVALFFAVATTPEEKGFDGKIIALNAMKLNKFTRFSKYYSGVHIPACFNVIFRSLMTINYDLPSILDHPESQKNWFPDRIEVRKIKVEYLHTPSFIEKTRMPIAVFPNRKIGRMTSQLSMFTIHGGKLTWDIQERKSLIEPPLSLEEINEKRKEEDLFLRVFTIPKNKKEKIREELRILGIHEGMLFPELDYQSTYIKNQWRFKKSD